MTDKEFKIEDHPHLSTEEWKVLKRMYAQLGHHIVQAILKLSPEEQRATIYSFALDVASNANHSQSSAKPMKLSVNPYGGTEGENVVK